MNQTISNFFEFALAVILTMTALAYTFWSMTDWPNHFELVPSAATVFVEHTEIPEEVPWSGSQVVAKLYQLSEDNVPIIVDGHRYETEIDVLKNQSYVSLTSNYSSAVQLNENGQVMSIIFKKVV